MTDTRPKWDCGPDPITGEFDHYWQYKSDWAGDPGVIGGTYDMYYRVCRECGVEEPCDAGDMPSFDDDDE